MTVEDRRKALIAQACECSHCADCGGRGLVDRETGTYPEFEPEPCDMCSGGIVEECDRCMELEELEREDDL